MLFRKKRDMVDVRELQRRGVVRIPKNEVVVPTNKEGFVELGSSGKIGALSGGGEKKVSNASFFGYNKSSQTVSSSSSTESYTKREVDSRMIDLDNKLYKIEQRLELIERKLGLGSSSSSGDGLIGW